MTDEENQPATRKDVVEARDAILNHIEEKVIKSVEGMRAQNSAEHGWMQRVLRSLEAGFSNFMERFQFLKPKAEPPDIKGRVIEPGQDDTQ